MKRYLPNINAEHCWNGFSLADYAYYRDVIENCPLPSMEDVVEVEGRVVGWGSVEPRIQVPEEWSGEKVHITVRRVK